MNRTAKITTLLAIGATMCWASASQASFFGLPRAAMKFQLQRLSFDTPVLPPIGHTRFCLQYPTECEAQTIDFRRRNIALTPERLNELNEINRRVNRDIVPEVTAGNGVTEEWIIAPAAGDCKDYAITKRHELLAKGWPARALLLSEVIVPDGEHHLVLVVRTKDVDLVLDNLNANIRPVAMTFRQYQWVRIETQQNPKFWVSVRAPADIQTAMLSAGPATD
jgi:predicted transglutaminase-like cysteine proteinase